MAGVFRSKLLGFLVCGGLFYLFKLSLLIGFNIGSMMVFRTNFGMMNGVGNRCCLLNSQIFFCRIIDIKVMLQKNFLFTVDM